MSNLLKRSLSSVVFVLLILGPLFIDDKIAYTLYGVLGFFTLNEVFKLAEKVGSSPQKALGFALYVVMVLVGYELLIDPNNLMRILLLVMSSLVLSSILLEIFKTQKLPFESLSVTLFSPLYTALSFVGIAYFTSYRTDLLQPWMVISLFGLIWINDSAAYLVGRKLGKRKLIERLSPGKTIEGSLGGVVFALATAIGLSFIEGMPSLLVMLGFGVVCVVFGALGDLFESRIKRAAGVKDSGVFLPGHGGFFDRFDAMMFAIPAAILYFEAVLPKQ